MNTLRGELMHKGVLSACKKV